MLYLYNSIATKFPYLVQKKYKEGQEVRRVAQLDWRIIEDQCEKPFVASGLGFVPLPVSSSISFLIILYIYHSFVYLSILML
jgi:hypothetical protein